jgi:hypothetical protein
VPKFESETTHGDGIYTKITIYDLLKNDFKKMEENSDD